MKRLVLTGVALLSVSALAAAAVEGAAAATAPAGGRIAIWTTPSNGPTSKIVITGAIGDYGTATTIDKNGKPDNNGDYVKIALKQGSFEVNSVVLNKKTDNAAPTMTNMATCSAEFGGSGPVTLFDGKGGYAGISGTLRITETFAAVGGRYASGAKKGQCNLSNNSEPLAFWGSITGAGQVKFAQ
jgi:hypothetical protein